MEGCGNVGTRSIGLLVRAAALTIVSAAFLLIIQRPNRDQEKDDDEGEDKARLPVSRVQSHDKYCSYQGDLCA